MGDCVYFHWDMGIWDMFVSQSWGDSNWDMDGCGLYFHMAGI